MAAGQWRPPAIHRVSTGEWPERRPRVLRDAKRLCQVGGVSWIVAGLLFMARSVLDHIAGPPPSNGTEILAWVASHKLALALSSEVLFFATMALVPGVIALHQTLVGTSRATAATGCGIIATVVPVMAVLLIVHGRLVYPVYGLRVDTPAAAELVVAIFYGGLHVVSLLMAVATFVLSLPMRSGAYGPRIAYLGFATSVVDVVGGYPDAIGALPALVCQAFFAAWFVVVGARLRRIAPA